MGAFVEPVKGQFVRPMKTGAAAFPARLARLRGELRKRDGSKVTQDELGAALRVSGQAVGAWENGINEPSLATIERLAAVLRVSPGELAFGEQANTVPDASPLAGNAPRTDAAAPGRRRVAREDDRPAKRKRGTK